MTIKKSIILLLGICLIVLSCQRNEFIVKDLTLEAIPDNLVYKGNLIEAKKWTDKNGDNILIISRYGPYRTSDFNLQNVTDEETIKFAKKPFDIPDGRYINDSDFKNAPPEFLSFSKDKWIEYCDKDSVKQFYPTDYKNAKLDDKHKPKT